jgi:hypothetical protein
MSPKPRESDPQARESDPQARESDAQDFELDVRERLHGAYYRPDLVRTIGLPAVRSLVRSGRLVRYSRWVLVDRRTQLELHTRAAAALLTAGPEAVLTSHTAALLYGCTAADSGAIHVLTRYERQIKRRAGLAVHQGSFDEQDVVELGGLRVLALEVVIAELLCKAFRPTALACADQALGMVRPESRAEFKAELEHRLQSRPDPRGRRRGGVLLLLATGVPESPAESQLLVALFDAGLPVPEAQFAVCDLDGRERYRLDFAWPEPMVALEYDGYAAHAGRSELDAARDEDLRRRGWLVVRAGASDLRDPGRLMREIRSAFWRRRFVA